MFAAAPGRSAKRPLEDQLRQAGPAEGAESVLHIRRPVRVRSEADDGAESRDHAQRTSVVAASAAGPRQAAPARSKGQQRQQRSGGGGRRLTGKLAYDRDTNVMITSSSSADEVLRIMDERGLEMFNDVNLATAFHRLARVRRCRFYCETATLRSSESRSAILAMHKRTAS